MATLRLKIDSGGISAADLARRLNLTITTVNRWCEQGRIVGARRDPITWQWWMFPPGLLIAGVR